MTANETRCWCPFDWIVEFQTLVSVVETSELYTSKTEKSTKDVVESIHEGRESRKTGTIRITKQSEHQKYLVG